MNTGEYRTQFPLSGEYGYVDWNQTFPALNSPVIRLNFLNPGIDNICVEMEKQNTAEHIREMIELVTTEFHKYLYIPPSVLGLDFSTVRDNVQSFT